MLRERSEVLEALGLLHTHSIDLKYFNWKEYLKSTGSKPAPYRLFEHVDRSVESVLQVGMQVELQNTDDDTTYWRATILLACGPLIRLQYLGLEEHSELDFWLDVHTTDIHPLGFADEDQLVPPEAVIHLYTDIQTLLINHTSTHTAPNYIERGRFTAVSVIKENMKLEVISKDKPYDVWVAEIVACVGGRLLLRYLDCSIDEFWLFYSSRRLRPLGWARGTSKYSYVHPDTHPVSQEDINTLLAQHPCPLISNKQCRGVHEFRVGMQLEMIHVDRVYSAEVCQVLDDHYFYIQNSQSRVYLCNTYTQWILPTGWGGRHGYRVDPPVHPSLHPPAPTSAFHHIPCPPELLAGCKLEVAHPLTPHICCVATVQAVLGHLLYIQPDNNARAFLCSWRSKCLFPVHWSHSNHAPLRCPHIKPPPNTDKKYELSMCELRDSLSAGDNWCPAIYFNHKCYSGQFLSKGRLSRLPRVVGPGPLDLVLKQALCAVVSIAYTPTQLMSKLKQVDVHKGYKLTKFIAKTKCFKQEEGPPHSQEKELVRVKCQVTVHKGVIPLCTAASQVTEFCTSICSSLLCCPSLFSTRQVQGSHCPESCKDIARQRYLESKLIYGKKPQVAQSALLGPQKKGRKKKKVIASRATTRNSLLAGKHSATLATAESLKHKYTKVKPSGKRKRRVSGEVSVKMSRVDNPALPVSIPSIQLQSNPREWSIQDVCRYIGQTGDCQHLTDKMQCQEIDGIALLLLNLPTLTTHMGLSYPHAVNLCHHIEKIKLHFYTHYSTE